MSGHFRYARRESTGPAALAVSESWTVEASTCTASVEGALPDDCVEIYFNLGPHGRHQYDPMHGAIDIAPRSAWVVGPRARTLLIAKETRDCLIVGVRLRAGTARHVLGAPVSEFVGQLVDLDALWHARVESVRDQMAMACSARARFDIVEREIVRRVGNQIDSVTPNLCSATTAVDAGSIGAIAAAMGLSHRKFIAWFDEHVGLKPKEFQRVHRLRRVLPALGAQQTPLARIAACAGYYDEAHFVHDFHKLTGFTPGGYAAKRMSIGHGSTRYLAAR